MFRLLILAVLGFSLNVNAAGKWKQVEENRVPLFKRALAEALNEKSFECNGTVAENGSIKDSILNFAAVLYSAENAQEIWTSEDLSQPLIYVKAEEQGYRTTLHFTTTADRKSVTKIDLQQTRFEIQHRNIGTIDKPVYTDIEVILQDVNGTCQ